LSATILCVDDDRHFCQILARALGAEGFEVRLAHDGEQALATLETDPADLMLLDVMLPRRDGFEVLETLRSMQGPVGSLPVVFLSGCSGGPPYAERAARLGAHACLTKPIPLEQLVGAVRKALDLAPPARTEAVRAPIPEREILQGNLADLPFPALLHHLHGLRADGVLQLRVGRKRKAVQLRGGRPVAVRSNLIGECLGNLLVRLGRIEQRELDESLARMRRGEGMQGQILVAMELLSEDELGALLRHQAEEKLFEIFAWRSGEFRFLRDARLAKANALALDQSPANLVLRGILERMPSDLVDAALGARSDCVAALGESPYYRFQEIDLDAPGRALLEELAQTPPLTDLRRRDERTRRILYALIATDMVELRDRRTNAAPGGRPPAVARASAPPTAKEPAAPARDMEAGLRAELEKLAERLRGRDYFDVLGVSQEADTEEIRGAYEDAARRTHPDRFRGASDAVERLAEEVFGLLSRAYETLSDPRQRQAYLIERQADSRDARELEEGRRALQAELRFQEGEKLLRRRDYEGALASFEEAVTLFPEEGEYHAYRGWALFLARRGDPRAEKEALSHIRKGRKLAPDREKPYLFLGRLHREAGRAQNAEKCFTRVLQINPDCVEAVRELRLIHMRREKAKGRIGRWLRR
jgi:CheY-like chemotaxis protein/DnaJ-domain-containing protein 1